MRSLKMCKEEVPEESAGWPCFDFHLLIGKNADENPTSLVDFILLNLMALQWKSSGQF